jgi:hypothetical protein
MIEYNNTMYFENGIKHEFTEYEIKVIKYSIQEFVPSNDNEKEALEHLKSLFLEHLD